MAQVTIRINGYAYTVGCEDGQEDHLARMAAEIEQRINSIKAIGGQSGEARLLMLASLLLADELYDVKNNGASSSAAQAPEPAASEGGWRAPRQAAPGGGAGGRNRLRSVGYLTAQ